MSGAGLFCVAGLSLGLSTTALFPLEADFTNMDRFTATLALALSLLAVVTAGAGWWSPARHPLGASTRLFLLAEALLIAEAVLVVLAYPNWHRVEPDVRLLKILPFPLAALAICGAPFVYFSIRALQRALAARRGAATPTIDSYLDCLSVCLRTTPRLRWRILHETEDHLRLAAEEVGEKKAIRRFGTPEQVAEGFASESRVARSYAVAWTTLVVVASGIVVLLAVTADTLITQAKAASSTTNAYRVTGVTWDWGARSPLEPLTSWLTSVPPPLRGGIAIALAVTAALALALALAAVAVVRRKPRLAATCALLAMLEGALGLGLACALERRLYDLYVLPFGVNAQRSAAIGAVVALTATLWLALELVPRSIRVVPCSTALCALVALPLIAGLSWQAPHPPTDGYWGLRSSDDLDPAKYVVSKTAHAPVAMMVAHGRIAVATVGPVWTSRRQGGRLVARATKVEIRGLVLSVKRNVKPRRSVIAVPVSDPGAIRTLAVWPTAKGAVLAWGTAGGLWLRVETSARQIASGHANSLHLFSAGGRLVLIATVGRRRLIASAPDWRPRALPELSGELLSVQAARNEFVTLERIESESDLRLDLRNASGSVERQWAIPLRIADGVTGLLPGGRFGVAYSGMAGGHYALWLGTIRGERLERRLVSDDRPCAIPMALGSVDRAAAVLTRSRCSTPSLTAADPMSATYEFVAKGQGWDRYEYQWRMIFRAGAYLDGFSYAISEQVSYPNYAPMAISPGQPTPKPKGPARYDVYSTGDSRLAWPQS
jgi:hypothetical protein